MRKISTISTIIVILALLFSETGWANIQHYASEPLITEEHNSLQSSKKDVSETLALVSVPRKLNKSNDLVKLEQLKADPIVIKGKVLNAKDNTPL
jgi:hypothetical protein